MDDPCSTGLLLPARGGRCAAAAARTFESPTTLSVPHGKAPPALMTLGSGVSPGP